MLDAPPSGFGFCFALLPNPSCLMLRRCPLLLNICTMSLPFHSRLAGSRTLPFAAPCLPFAAQLFQSDARSLTFASQSVHSKLTVSFLSRLSTCPCRFTAPGFALCFPTFIADFLRALCSSTDQITLFQASLIQYKLVECFNYSGLPFHSSLLLMHIASQTLHSKLHISMLSWVG